MFLVVQVGNLREARNKEKRVVRSSHSQSWDRLSHIFYKTQLLNTVFRHSVNIQLNRLSISIQLIDELCSIKHSILQTLKKAIVVKTNLEGVVWTWGTSTSFQNIKKNKQK